MRSIDLFAGAGGFSIASEKLGFNPIIVNEIDKWACATLKHNRSKWNIVEDSIYNLSFNMFENADLLTGGFPCQSFSQSGTKMGLKDKRGDLFFEFFRAIQESKPKIFIGENVKGILTNDRGNTIRIIYNHLYSLKNYKILDPIILEAEYYNVPQKRHRVFIIGIRTDQNIEKFKIPPKTNYQTTIEMALKAGALYKTDVPASKGSQYSENKKKILSYIPPGGNWKNLPANIQKEYMGNALYSEGGKTGMARRLHWQQPSLTLTTSPSQKQTERCHPDEIRPLTIREYARIQTFPDEWEFCGSVSNIYKQIGNAVPVNLGVALINSLKNCIEF